jgi:hypothetical protein
MLALAVRSPFLSIRSEVTKLVLIAFFSFILIALLFYIQGRAGFSLWDEGYLWYGAQRVMVGEVPMRDFDSYDPGRYYWSAALMGLWGDNGIMALRAAVASFQALGLFICLALLARNTSKAKIVYLLLAATTLVVWMFPRHKLFDISLSIALVGALSFLVQQPSNRRYFLTGLFVGIIAVFGRNHGMYGVAGSLGVMAYLACKRENGFVLLKAFAVWTAGAVIGSLPVLLMIAAVPGFALAFWESILLLFEFKTTNLPVAVPWPWRVPFGQVPPVEVARSMLVGLFFVGIVAFGVLSIAWAIRQRLQNKLVSPELVASAFLALPYAHFAYSRADIGHLAQGIFPFLIGSFVLLSRQHAKVKWPFAALLCGGSLLVMLPLHPGWQCYSSQQCVEVNVAGSKLKIDSGTAGDLALLNNLSEQFAPGTRSFIATPFWPGAYAALERKAPMRAIYALLPRSDAFQHSEIERIKAANPGFAIIFDLPLDGRDELRFRNTHPLIDQYIRDHFELLNGYTKNPAYQIYRSKQDLQ